MESFSILDELTLRTEEQDDVAGHGIGPAVLVGVGGTGSEVLSRVKAQVHWLGLGRLFEFVVVDSDNRAMGGSTNGMPFAGKEYCHLDFRRMDDVLEHPNLYPRIAERLDLGDSAVLNAMRVKIESFGEDEGCGQIRPIGALRFASNYTTFSNRLTRAVGRVQNVWNRLLDRLQGVRRGRVQEANLPVLVVGSICGGTGSAVLVDTIVAIRSLVQDVAVRGYLTLPSVYEQKINAGQLERVRANAYATLKEIEFFQRGIGREQGFRFEYPGASIPAPNTLFNLCYLIERRDAAGSDLGELGAVYDALALAITSEIALSVGARLRMENANQAAVNLAVHDLEMGAPRSYSTLGATAVAIPRRRLVRLGAFRAARELLENWVLGPEAPPEDVLGRVSTFLKTARVSNPSDRDRFQLAEDIRTRARVNTIGYVDRLFKKKKLKGRAQRESMSDKVFIPAYDDFENWWKNQGRDAAGVAAAKSAVHVAKPLAQRLGKLVHEELAEHGLVGCDQALDTLVTVLEKLQQMIGDEIGACRSRATELFGEARKASQPMRGFFGEFGTDTKAQREVATHLEAALLNDVNTMVLAEADTIIASLAQRAADWDQDVERAIEVRKPDLREAAKREQQTLSHADDIFGDSNMEISVMGRDDMLAVCDTDMPGAELLDSTAHTLGGNAELQAYLHPDFGEELLRRCGQHYVAVAAKLNVADVIHKGVKAGGKPRVRKLIEEGIRACQPLWAARAPGGLEFPESIVVGIPKAEGSPAWKTVAELVTELTPDLQRPGYTHTDPALESISDDTRVYITRRCHGGRPHYLSTWGFCKHAYGRLEEASGALSLHGFSREVVGHFPPLDPDPHTSADLAFALAMAMGWIAKRGAVYYVNLFPVRASRDGRDRFRMRIVTQWNCLVAEDGKRKQGTVLSPLQQSKTITVGTDTRADPRHKLANNRAGAQKKLRTEQFTDLVELVMRLMEEHVLDATPPSEVADALETYVEEHVETRTSSSASERAALNREATRIRAHVQVLREM